MSDNEGNFKLFDATHCRSVNCRPNDNVIAEITNHGVGQLSTEKLPVGLMFESHLSAGQLSAGKLSAGQISAGQTSASQLSASQLSSSQLSASQLCAGQLSVGQMSAGQLSAGQLSAPPVIRRPVICQPNVGQQNVSKICWQNVFQLDASWPKGFLPKGVEMFKEKKIFWI
jgi:hypothetical protein